MNKKEDSTRALVTKLGYKLNNGNHPAYTLALCLKKLSYDRDKIIQAITIVYPPENNSLHPEWLLLNLKVDHVKKETRA